MAEIQFADGDEEHERHGVARSRLMTPPPRMTGHFPSEAEVGEEHEGWRIVLRSELRTPTLAR